LFALATAQWMRSTMDKRKRTLKKALLAAASAAAVMFSLAGLYSGVIARGFIANNVDSTMLRQPPNLVLVFIGYLLLAMLMTALYGRFVRGPQSPAWSGLRFGMAAGVCWLMPYSLVLFGVYRFPFVALPMDLGWALIEQGIGGLVIGLIYGKSAGN
jgi:hypothetical protein